MNDNQRKNDDESHAIFNVKHKNFSFCLKRFFFRKKILTFQAVRHILR